MSDDDILVRPAAIDHEFGIEECYMCCKDAVIEIVLDCANGSSGDRVMDVSFCIKHRQMLLDGLLKQAKPLNLNVLTIPARPVKPKQLGDINE